MEKLRRSPQEKEFTKMSGNNGYTVTETPMEQLHLETFGRGGRQFLRPSDPRRRKIRKLNVTLPFFYALARLKKPSMEWLGKNW